MPILIVERGNERGRRFDLKPGARFVFGRDEASTLVTSDHLCSRQHFAVEERNGAWVAVDLGSSNGTFVNEERITERTLAFGDFIGAGETQLLYHQDEASAGRGLAGKVVGGYKILERLGRGGMGTVYKANQISLNRVVALKVLSHRVSADPAFVKRFQAEAQAAGRLNHPNIVQVYDVGNDQRLHYYSMEYIENGSVQTLATKLGTLPMDLAIAVITDAARGLVYAEKRNLVHRDIKPDNLMINSEGVVKIADLGLARDAGERARHSGEKSEGTGEDSDIFGTPHFISPEQAQGKAVDTRSDIYSLGATFYRLTAGQTPFSGENVQEIIQKQIDEEPVPIRKQRKDCSPAVAAIIEKMMQKDPGARYQSAQDLLNDLESLEKTAAGGSGKLVAAIVALVVLAGGGFAAWKALGAKPEVVVAPPVDTKPTATRPSTDDGSDLNSTEQEREAARVAFLAVRDAEDQAVAAGNADWPALRTRYQTVADSYARTAFGKNARERVTAIDKIVAANEAKAAALAAAAESRAAAVRGSIEKAKSAAETAAKEDRFADALAAVQKARREIGPGAEGAALDQLTESLKKQAIARVTALGDSAKALEQAGKLDDAEKLLRDAAAAFVGENTGTARQPFENGAAQLTTAAAGVRARGEERNRADMEHDRQLVFQTRKSVGTSLTHNFDPDQAKTALTQASNELRRADQKAAIAADLEALDAAIRLRTQWVEFLQAQIPRGLKLKLPTSPDRKKTGDFTIVSVNSTGLVGKRGTGEMPFTFSSFTTVEFYDYFLKDWVEKNDATHADAAQLLMLGGAPDRALDLANTLKDPAVKDSLIGIAKREAEAAALLAEVRDLAQKATTDESVTGRLYRKVNRLLDEFGTTRTTLMNRRAPPAPMSRPTSRDSLR